MQRRVSCSPETDFKLIDDMDAVDIEFPLSANGAL